MSVHLNQGFSWSVSRFFMTVSCDLRPPPFSARREGFTDCIPNFYSSLVKVGRGILSGSSNVLWTQADELEWHQVFSVAETGDIWPAPLSATNRKKKCIITRRSSREIQLVRSTEQRSTLTPTAGGAAWAAASLTCSHPFTQRWSSGQMQWQMTIKSQLRFSAWELMEKCWNVIARRRERNVPSRCVCVCVFVSEWRVI